MALAGLFFFFSAIVSSSQQQKVRSQVDGKSRSNGQRAFASNCAGCHGLDGTGTQRAPNIASNPHVQKLSAKEIQRIVSDGIPGTGMPAFRSMGKAGVTAVTSYLRTLQGGNGAAALPGNADKGKSVFFGFGGCSACHMIGGSGGFIAPDLSAYGQTHSADQIKSAITNPAERSSPQGVVTAVAADGRRWEGIVRNEDNFSLQLQAPDGTFHFFSKADLRAVERASRALMPSDYGSKLSKTQLDDLVSYLLSVGKTAVPPRKHQDENE